MLSAMSSTDFHVEERDGDIVTCDDFCAVYFKPDAQPQLILRSCTPTDDHGSLSNRAARKTGAQCLCFW